jgi:predicted translin family RNA/ssDNA-binding protein
MADEQDNLVIRMLRDIRGDTMDTRQRLVRVERHVEEMREQMVTAMGMAGMATVSVEKQGERLDEISDELEALRRRIAALENRT